MELEECQSMELNSPMKKYGYLTLTQVCYQWLIQALTLMGHNSSLLTNPLLGLMISTLFLEESFMVWIFAE